MAENKVMNRWLAVVGAPIIIGWVNSDGLPYILFAFIAFLFVMAIVLWFSFRNLRGIIFPLLLGGIASIWGFGIYAVMMGETLRSSSVFLVPFVLIASACCHSVQVLKRFGDEEYPATQEPGSAITNTFTFLSLPIVISLVTDMTGFLVLACIPFDNVSVVGSVTVFGMFSMILCTLLFFIPLLSYFPGRPKKLASEGGIEREDTFIIRTINNAVGILVNETKVRWFFLSGLGVVLIISVVSLFRIDFGQDNTYAIHNFLTKSWKKSPVYQMEMQIKENFKGIYPLIIVVKTKEPGGLKEPEALKKIDNFATFLQTEIPEVAGTMNLPVFVKLLHRFYNGGDERYFIVPDDKLAIGEYLWMYTAGGEPGSFDAVMDFDFQSAVLTAYVENTSPATVKKCLAMAKDYAQNHFNDEKISAQLAGGTIGIMQAFNDSIQKWFILATLFAALASYAVMVILLRSFIGGLYLMLPEVISIIIWIMIMYLSGIEMNSNATTSAAILMGVGVDAEIYYLFRFWEEFKKTKDFKRSLISGFSKIRQAIIFSNLALILGCWSLIPIPLYLGYVGYGMGMALLVVFIVSFIIDPTLWSLLKPKFLFKTEGLA